MLPTRLQCRENVPVGCPSRTTCKIPFPLGSRFNPAGLENVANCLVAESVSQVAQRTLNPVVTHVAFS
jgi:hypothetical protein